MVSDRRIACCLSEKKSQKVNWSEFERISKKHGFEFFKLDLNSSIESQGPFCVLLHKLTDIIASAKQGDSKCTNLINTLEKYLAKNPEIIVIDPLPNVRCLLDRYKAYSIIHSTNLYKYSVFTPNFCELTMDNTIDLTQQLKNAKVTFPFICKPYLGHGSRQAHKMSIIFNEKGLVNCKTPSVAQSFINHNAVLYKIFIIGNSHHFVERPSLKNFYDRSLETINFDSGDVSKANSQSHLTVLDHIDQGVDVKKPDPLVMEVIAETLRDSFGMDLLGVDVVIENDTGKYAIIDVNSYPGYDGFPNYLNALLECINAKVDEKTDSSAKSESVECNNCINIPNGTITT